MLVLVGFAFISGIVTILSPCILPIAPVVLSGGVSGGKARPFGVVTGFIASFVVFTLSLSAIVQATGISPEIPRYMAVVILVAFGLVMIVPALRDRFELWSSDFVSRFEGLRAPPNPAEDGMARPLAASMATDAGSASQQARPTARAHALSGYGSGIVMGLGLGIVWTPCVGPIMASVIGLAVANSVDARAVVITVAYAVGTAIPMLAVMVGGKALIAKASWLLKRSDSIQRVLGVLMIVVGVVVLFGWERQFQTAVLNAAPGYGSGLTALEDNDRVRKALAERNGAANKQAMTGMTTVTVSDTNTPVFRSAGSTTLSGGVTGDYGYAPQLVAEGPWINSAPLTMESLKGKVVVVEFWTYSCVNCVRTLPYLRVWYETYNHQGLVIIGVHSPEFAFERELANVRKASTELEVTWPVVLDNRFVQWRAYGNNYWPALYFIDGTGKVRYFQFGEGEYAIAEQVIRTLLAEAGKKPSNPAVLTEEPAVSFGNTPETYIGSAHAARFEGAPALINGHATYKAPKTLSDNAWSLQGSWYVEAEFASPQAAGILELNFDAKDVFMVIAPEPEGAAGSAIDTAEAEPIGVLVDGEVSADTADVKGGNLKVTASRMYHLVMLPRSGKHRLRIDTPKGYRFFVLTFG
jgi:cytochrome c biogenesis protein CcdA/thiol-disulfide isomerase/thioredoxin